MEKVFEGSKAFLNIPVGVARDKELLKKPKTILLMGEIISMLNVTGEFFMSNKKISERLQVSTRTVNDYLDILEKKNLIIREKIMNDENGAIIGRKIRAGAALVKYISLGWGSTLHEGSEADFTPLVKPTSHKKNSINRSSNRAVNKSSSGKKEEDPEREKIYKEFFRIARMNDKLKSRSTNPSYDEMKQLRSLLYRCSISTLQATKDKFKERMEWDMVGKPFAYLLKLLRDGLANDQNYESWG